VVTPQPKCAAWPCRHPGGQVSHQGAAEHAARREEPGGAPGEAVPVHERRHRMSAPATSAPAMALVRDPDAKKPLPNVEAAFGSSAEE
jgi:hypothetical protein